MSKVTGVYQSEMPLAISLLCSLSLPHIRKYLVSRRKAASNSDEPDDNGTFMVIVYYGYLILFQGISGDALRSSVYEQWLVGDLSALEEPFLDKAVGGGNKLSGNHAVQVCVWLRI